MTRLMSALDASFLYLERPEVPMHVGALTIVGRRAPGRGPVSIDELKRLIRVRLDRLPGFRLQLEDQRLLGIRRPRWQVLADIDFDYHVHRHLLRRPGSMRQLAALAARIHEQPLRKDRPLWEAHLIDGLPRGRQALLIKMHHSITDGVAGMEIAGSLFDPVPGAHRPHPVPTAFITGHDGALRTVAGGLGVARLIAGGPLAPLGPFSKPVRGQRSLGLATIPRAALLATQERYGGSLADILLALVARALGIYLAANPTGWTGSELRVMLPVSTRPPGSPVSPGTQVTSVFVNLPVDCTSMRECIERIAMQKAELRAYREASGVGYLVTAAGMLPAPLHAALVRLVGGLPMAHLVVSDVPGPTQHLALLGAPVEVCYPLMPVAPFSGASIAAITMGDMMGVGLTFDAAMVPDATQIARNIEHALPVAPLQQPPRQHAVRLPAGGVAGALSKAI